jgi:DNA-binding beta-propeller fold protein YncE
MSKSVGMTNKNTKVHHGLMFLLVALAVLACVAQSSIAASSYQYQAQFGAPGSGDGQLQKPLGVAIDETAHDVYVTDAENHRVDKFSGSGAFLATWGWGVSDGVAHSEVCTTGCQQGLVGAGEGQFGTPEGIAVDNSGGASEGNVYVGDGSNAVVQEFDSSGKYLRSLSAGTGGPFTSIYGVAVDRRGNLWVYDSVAEVYEFNSSGLELQQWFTGYGSSPGFAVDASDNVYAVRGALVIEKFSPTGTDLGELDTGNENTTGVAFDPVSNRAFSDQGTFVASYERPETLPVSPSITFGTGLLSSGTGLAVDSGNGKVYVADSSNDEVFVFAPPPPEPPKIERVFVTKVLDSSAELHISLHTGNVDTKYYIEYGTTPSYGNVSPAGGVDIGSSFEEVASNHTVTGLAPATTYYYRVVATNSQGTVSWNGAHDEFTTAPLSGGSFVLPDNRGFEMVSPSEKNGGDPLTAVTRATPDGSAVMFSSIASGLEGSHSAKASQYISTRGPNGWSTEPIVPPANESAQALLELPYFGFSKDLSTGVLMWPFGELTPEAPVGYSNLYLHNNRNDTYRLITIGAPAHGNKPVFVGASASESVVIFEAEDALTENAVQGSSNVYEWADGRLSLVSVPPGSGSGVGGAHAGSNVGIEISWQNPVSADGRTVFWHDGQSQLYARENGNETIKLNASKRKASLGDGSATFEGATPDGEHVFFSDATPLTEASGDSGGLYEFDATNRELTDLTPNAAGSPNVQGVVGFSEDGSYVYFVADEPLETISVAGQPAAVAGENNLYVSHGGQVRFIATLNPNDSADWYRILPNKRNSAVTSDGLHLAFMSSESLTGYNNLDVNTGASDTEVFEYDFNGGKLRCVSCNPTGGAPIGRSNIPTWETSDYNSFYLANSGDRLFFQSSDALLPRDTNGVQDVYEWERQGSGGCAQASGCVYLISTGTSNSESTFLAASEDGHDVFVMTRSRLLPQDHDEDIDVYDARVDGGFPVAPTPAPCVDEACQGGLTSAPESAMPLTAFLSPSSGESGRSSAQRASFHLAPIGRQALRRFARTGRLELTVAVSGLGTVWAKATTGSGRGSAAIASDARSVRRAGNVRLDLVLTRSARKRLSARHKYGVTITIGYSRATARKHVHLVLQGSGAMR